MVIDLLIDKIRDMKNPSAIGLDTCLDYLPPEMTDGIMSANGAAKAVFEFNKRVIDAVCDIAPAVKVQAAYYEMYGWQGMKTFFETLRYAKSKGLIVIADVKRNDIGSTAAAYSAAYLGQALINSKAFTGFDSDFVTLNAYLGIDGIKPFLDDCKKYGKGVFILCKTSNPGSGQLQDLYVCHGDTVMGTAGDDTKGQQPCHHDRTLYETMGGLISEWGKELIGKNGYSAAGAVVGATHREQAQVLRKLMPHTFFLVPGYGAQGGKLDDLKVCFDREGGGAIVNSSRAILCAYKNERYKGLAFDKAARQAAADMKNELGGVYGR